VTTDTGNGDQLLVARDDARHRLGDIPPTRLAVLERDGQIKLVRDGRRTFVVASSLKSYVQRLREANRNPACDTQEAGD
jgi:hypothetical protein